MLCDLFNSSELIVVSFYIELAIPHRAHPAFKACTELGCRQSTLMIGQMIKTITLDPRILVLVPAAHEDKGPATELEEEAAEMMPSVPPSVPAILLRLEGVAIWMRMEPQPSRRVVAWVAALVTISTSRLGVDQETLSRSAELIPTLTFPVTFRATTRATRHPPSRPSSAPAAIPTTDLKM